MTHAEQTTEHLAQAALRPQATGRDLREGEPEAIFIVGSSRSGTSLMRTVLERSPRISLARENHFLGHIWAREGARHYLRQAGDLASDDSVARLVEMLYGGEYGRQSRWRELSTFWKWLISTVPAAEMEQRLLAADRNERGMFVAFLRAYADRKGGPIIGEKTPAHLAYVDTLIDWFPNARVIHMLRDPRAVYVSDLRRRRGKLRKPYAWFARVPGLLSLVILLQTVWVWRSAVRHHTVYESRHQHYRLVRFEDLVLNPEPTLSEVFKFLNVEMPSDVTEVDVVSSGFSAGAHGLDADAASRWRLQIGTLSKRSIEVLLRRPMRRMGYV